MEDIIQFLKENKLLLTKISKHTFLIDEDQVSQGVLVFVPYKKNKEMKVVIPAPFHEILFSDKQAPPTYQQVLTNQHALLLR